MPRASIEHMNARRAAKPASGGKTYSRTPKYAPDREADPADVDQVNWRDHLPVHPAADLFPLMSEAELKELADDIKKHGLAEPVALRKESFSVRNDRTVLIDGRNRLDALVLLGEKIFDKKGRVLEAIGQFPEDAKDDPVSYVISKNVHRRHLTPEQKRDLIAKALKANPDQSNNQVAKQTKADDKTVAKVRADLESRSEIPNVETRTDTKGRKQPAKKSKPDTATESTRPQEIVDALNPTAEASAEARRAHYAAEEDAFLRSTLASSSVTDADTIEEPCTDCDTPEQFWQRSLSNLAGDAIAMRAYWTRQFGEWEKFEVPSNLVTVAEQAADAWTKLAATIKARAA